MRGQGKSLKKSYSLEKAKHPSRTKKTGKEAKPMG